MWNNYTSKKSAGTGVFAKESEVTREAIAEVKDDDDNVVVAASPEEKREFIVYVEKRWDSGTGEALIDSKREITLSDLEREKTRFNREQSNAKAQSDGLASAIEDFKKL
jgi:hypothetical protein